MEFVFQTDVYNTNGIQNGKLHEFKFSACDEI